MMLLPYIYTLNFYVCIEEKESSIRQTDNTLVLEKMTFPWSYLQLCNSFIYIVEIFYLSWAAEKAIMQS